MTNMTGKKIAVIGGGIAGLTVAHECVEAGFEVHVYEKHPYFGGKAQGFHTDDGYPVEHSLRIYGATSYLSLFDTLMRIPFGNGKTVFDNLTPMDYFWIISYKDQIKSQKIPQRFSVNIFKRLHSIVRDFHNWGLSLKDIFGFFSILLSYLVMPDEKKRKVLWEKSFSDYYHLEKFSPSFRLYILAFADTIAAAKPSATAAVVADFFCRVFFSFHNPLNLESKFSVMNGPTNEQFIDPWVRHLAKLGVHFHLQSPVNHVEIKDDEVVSATIKNGTKIKADIYVLALPAPAAKHLIPSLGWPENLPLEWSMGLQFFLNRIPDHMKDLRTFFLFAESPWKVVCNIEGPELWPNIELPPNVKGILSVAISNIHEPGILFGKPFHACSPEEAMQEVLAQLSIKDPSCVLRYAFDQTIQYLTESEYLKNKEIYADWEATPVNEHGSLWVSENPLFIEKPGTFHARPVVNTAIKNLFLAGEYIDATLHLPTMEKANQTGKLCAESICRKFNYNYPKERTQLPDLPLKWIRNLNTFFYRLKNR